MSQHTGWRLPDQCFVLLNRVINFGSSELKVCPPPWTEQLPFGPVSMVGTIETWKETVAAEAQYSTRLMLMISCAFAAPLLRLANRGGARHARIPARRDRRDGMYRDP
jgi:uncharacterized protein (DUF927 family)